MNNGRKSSSNTIPNGRKSSSNTIPNGMIPITNDPMNPGGYRDPNTGYEYNYKGQTAWEHASDGSGSGRRYKIIPPNMQMQGAGGVSGGKNVAGSMGQPGPVNAVGEVIANNGMAPTSNAMPTQQVGTVQAAQGMPTMPMAAPTMTPEEWIAISQVQPMVTPQYIPTQMQAGPSPRMEQPIPIDPTAMAQILQMTPQEYLDIAPQSLGYIGSSQPGMMQPQQSTMAKKMPASAVYGMNGTR